MKITTIVLMLVSMLLILGGSGCASPATLENEEHGDAIIEVDYDEVWFVMLVFPSPDDERPNVFDKNGKPIKRYIRGARRIRREGDLERVAEILSDKTNFTDGTCDCLMCLYALVFYKNGKMVLRLSPNLTGSDLGAWPRKDSYPADWTGKGLGRFSNFCHEQVSMMHFIGVDIDENHFGKLPPPASK